MFTAADLVSITSILKDVALGLIELAYPDTRPSIMPYSNVNQNSQTSIWSHLLRVICLFYLLYILNKICIFTNILLLGNSWFTTTASF